MECLIGRGSPRVFRSQPGHQNLEMMLGDLNPKKTKALWPFLFLWHPQNHPFCHLAENRRS
jgi:hypothetical protein